MFPFCPYDDKQLQLFIAFMLFMWKLHIRDVTLLFKSLMSILQTKDAL